MEAVVQRASASRIGLLRGIEPGALAVWLLGAGLVAYLGLRGGGYDPIIRNQLGIAVWWALAIGVAVGALPRRRPGRAGWVALALFGGYLAWVALSLTWTESSERTMNDLGRILLLFGVFGLGLCVRGSQGARRMTAGLAAAISVVAIVGLLSRLHPAWFPDATETATFLETHNRLSYPLNFWNGLAALIAMGIPLALSTATSARTVVARSLAAGAIPAMALAAFFTFSRGGSAAIVLGVLVFLAFTSDRLAALATVVISGAGAAILIAAATQRNALEDGLLSSTAADQGDEMLAMLVVVCAGVALLQAGLSLAVRHVPRLRPVQLGPAGRMGVVAAAVAVVAIGLIAADAPGRASDAWSDFKSSGGAGTGAERLTNFAGNGRYQYWGAALDQAADDPLHGRGSGTFEFWWNRNGDAGGFVRDAHSLYAETIGELGLVGILLVGGFLAWGIGIGAARCVRARSERRAPLASALGGCAAFCLAAAFDWVWELTVIPIVLVLLVSVLVTAGAGGRPPRLRASVRAGVGVLAAVALVVLAIPVGSTSALRESQAAVRDGDLEAATERARTAVDLAPFASSPHLQLALVLELQGSLPAARDAAAEAVRREPTNWRPWVILSRIQAESGEVRASIRSYRRARTLNVDSDLFR